MLEGRKGGLGDIKLWLGDVKGGLVGRAKSKETAMEGWEAEKEVCLWEGGSEGGLESWDRGFGKQEGNVGRVDLEKGREGLQGGRGGLGC